MNLTSSQYRYLCAIRSFIESRGHSPTTLELANMVGVSQPVAHRAIHVLADKGFLRLVGPRNAGRCIELVPDSMQKLNSCFTGHERIWFFSDHSCPLCAVLARIAR